MIASGRSWAHLTALLAVSMYASRAGANDSKAAEAAYDRALQFYRAGDRVSALASMKESYRLSHEPDLLYDLGRLERELDHCIPALRSYRAYVSAVPDGAYTAASQVAIAQLEARCDAAPRHPSYWTAPRIIGWSSLVAAVGLGVGAVVLEVDAHAAQRDAQRWADVPVMHSWAPRGPSLLDDAQRDQNVAIGLTVAAGALAVSSALCLTLWGEHHGREAPSVSFLLRPGAGYVGYSKRF